MSIKDEKIEFRCTTALKSGLLRLRPFLGTRTLSATIRRLCEIATQAPNGSTPWIAIPALKEVALHLDRTASALQRILLTGAPAGELLTEAEALLARLRTILVERRGNAP